MLRDIVSLFVCYSTNEAVYGRPIGTCSSTYSNILERNWERWTERQGK